MSPLLRPTVHASHSLKVKGSRFIADVFPVDDETEIARRLEEVRQRERGATHICYAWCLGAPPTQRFRSSDAGEPAGSAGKPILQSIQGRSLTNILVTVTRYFGGVKLGIGGLIRAYGGVTREVLEKIETEPYIDYTELTMQLPYEVLGPIHRLIGKYQGQVIRQEGASQAVLTVRLPTALLEELKTAIRNQTHGRVSFSRAD